MSNDIPSRYKSTGETFKGGMGEILICEDVQLERKVAIKFIQDVKDQRRLFDEINALQNIRSKHVVQIFDAFLSESNRRVGIVQEYVSGDDLESFSGKQNLSLEQYLKILYQIASGLSDIHSQGLIHRDIKPNNMKFDESNIIKIFDFGLARFSSKDDSTLGFTGTLGFAAPELFRSGLVSFTSAVDSYAFGVMAWYLSRTPLSQAFLKAPPETDAFPSFSSLSLGLPSNIVRMLDLTLSSDVESRPSMTEARDLIGNHLLFGKHRGLIVTGDSKYVLEKLNQSVTLQAKAVGEIRIKYDGLDFVVDSTTGSVYINNVKAQIHQSLPKGCVITLGDVSLGGARQFITFDISNPEVVL
ncbi:MAG TPA: serine/threonine-protein kinase [Phormidium sp.]